MQVFHSLWDTKKFYFWAESSLSPAAPASPKKKKDGDVFRHPFALKGNSLSASFASVFPAVRSDSEVTATELCLRLPSSAKGPLPSPWLLLEDYVPEKPTSLKDCNIPALTLEPAAAAKLLLDLPLDPPPGTVYADSMHFWSDLSLFSMELVCRQQFIPALVENRPAWKAVIDDSGADEERFRLFVNSIPPGCLSFAPDNSPQTDPALLVRSFMDIAVDYLVRSSICDADILPSRRGRPAKSEKLSIQFLKSLQSINPNETAFDATDRELSGFSDLLSSWTAALQPQAVDVPFKTCFRLESPSSDDGNEDGEDIDYCGDGDGDGARNDGGGNDDANIDGKIDCDIGGIGSGDDNIARRDDRDLWRLSFFLQARDDKSLLVPANEVWRTRSSALTLLKKRLSNPQEQLLSDLGRAERVFPQIKESLEKARPTGLSMKTEAAYTFLRETAPLLEQNGFGVMLPSWWQRKSSQLGIKLRLKDARQKPGSSGPSFLGLNSLVEYDWQLSLGDKILSEAEFLQLTRLKVPLVKVRGEWTELRASDIEEAIEFFKKNSDRTMTLSEALHLVLDLSGQQPLDDQSDDGEYPLPIHGFSAEGQIEKMLKSLSKPSADLAETAPPADLNGTLRPYQLRGLSWLEYLQRLGLGACLADDMGLGKTVELIAFLLKRKHELVASAESGFAECRFAEISSTESCFADDCFAEDRPSVDRQENGQKASQRNSSQPNPSLLICPLSVAGNWQKEIERFAPTLKPLLHHGTTRLSGDAFLQEALSHDIVITTYSLAAKDRETLSAIPWSNVILDEAQAIKNHAALQTRSIKRLPSSHRIALTGTPVENRLSELWSIMDFLNPGYLGSSESFRRQFILPIEKYRNKSRSDALRSIIQPFVLRRLKTDPTVIRDLPEKMEMIVNCNLTEEQATLYSAVVEDMLADIKSQEGIKRRGIILAALTKLKQICNHPALFLQDASSIDGRSGKLSRLEEMLEEAVSVGDRSLIFTQFAGMGAMLRHHLQEKMGLEVLFLHGRTSKNKRDEMIARFQSGSTPVFILSLKAGGFGLNLTAANHVFHFDRWWNPAVENQATDRAFRIGQKKNVFVHKFVCAGTLEEKINQMIEQKKSLADSVIGSGESWLTEFSNEALRDMLTLRRDSVRSGDDEGGNEEDNEEGNERGDKK